MLLHVAVHASLHHRFDAGLRGLCDIAMIVRQRGSTIDWNALQRIGDAAGVLTALSVMLRLSKELIGAPVSDEQLGELMPHFHDDELIEWAKEQILAREQMLADPSSMSPRLARFMTAPLTTKVRSLLETLFPSAEDLARLYRVPFHPCASGCTTLGAERMCSSIVAARSCVPYAANRKRWCMRGCIAA
mgnify:CR=1 FL=1